MPAETSSEDCLKQVSVWLRSCLENHAGCKIRKASPESPTTLPTRLVDVGSLELGIEPSLVITKNLGVDIIEYVALSHRWGLEKFITLIFRNIDDFTKRLPFGDLRAVFQDAISLTRSLGIRYIWIDSLCIIQDSIDDWMSESAIMGEIYRNSLFTIAASAAAEGSENFYAKRDVFNVIPFSVNIKWKSHEGQYICFKGNLRSSGIADAALNQRGWVIQERSLSPRTVYFGRQLFWECRELMACRTCPRRFCLQHDHGERAIRSVKIREMDANSNTFNAMSWEGVVSAYTRCGLTKGEDKLIALSGIVKQLRRQYNNADYIAGLWRSELHQQLHWYMSSTENQAKPKTYRGMLFQNIADSL